MEDSLPPLLLGLDLLPALAHPSRARGLGLPEHVGMPPDELLVHPAGDGLEVALAPLLEEQRQEVDLEEKIAELAPESCIVARNGGVRDLVRLLERVRDDRERCLLPVPGAVATKLSRQLLEVEKRLRETHVLNPRHLPSSRAVAATVAIAL